MVKQKVTNEYCACGLRVAPYDPDKMEFNRQRFHKKYYRKRLSQALQEALKQKQPEQLYLL